MRMKFGDIYNKREVAIVLPKTDSIEEETYIKSHRCVKYNDVIEDLEERKRTAKY